MELMHPPSFLQKNTLNAGKQIYKKETDKRKFPRKNKYLKNIFLKNIYKKNICINCKLKLINEIMIIYIFIKFFILIYFI